MRATEFPPSRPSRPSRLNGMIADLAAELACIRTICPVASDNAFDNNM